MPPCLKTSATPAEDRDINMTVLSFTDKAMLAQQGGVVLYRGVTPSGTRFFAYLYCDLKGVEMIQKDYLHQSKPRDISEYGKLIYMDFKIDPDKSAEAFLQRYVTEAAELTRKTA